MSIRGQRSKRRGPSFLSHGHLIAAETILLVAAFKDWFFEHVKRGDFPNWAKVLFLMVATIGLLGGVFLIVQRMTQRGMSGAHATLRRQSGLPTLAIHVAILFLLFLLYARMLKLSVFA